MEYEEEPDNIEYEALKAKMNDGLEDTWLNVKTATIARYVDEQVLDELEELDKLLNNPSILDIQKVIDDRILRYAERLNRV